MCSPFDYPICLTLRCINLPQTGKHGEEGHAMDVDEDEGAGEEDMEDEVEDETIEE